MRRPGTGVDVVPVASDRAAAPPPGVRVVVAGPVYCDLVFGGLDRLPRLGEERFAPTFRVAAGGSAITAIALRRLGHVVTLASEVGDDDLGGVLRRNAIAVMALPPAATRNVGAKRSSPNRGRRSSPPKTRSQ